MHYKIYNFVSNATKINFALISKIEHKYNICTTYNFETPFYFVSIFEKYIMIW